MKCIKCNAELTGDSKFCVSCGTRQPETADDITATQPETKNTKDNNISNNNIPENKPVLAEQKSNDKQTSKVGIITGLICILLVLGAAGLGVWITHFDPFNFRGNDSADSSGSETAAPASTSISTVLTTTPTPETTVPSTTTATTTTTTTTVTTTTTAAITFNPRPEPIPATYDERLAGIWISENQDGDELTTIVFDSNGSVYVDESKERYFVVKNKQIAVFPDDVMSTSTDPDNRNEKVFAFKYLFMGSTMVITPGSADKNGNNFESNGTDTIALTKQTAKRSSDKFCGEWILSYSDRDDDTINRYYPMIINQDEFITFSGSSKSSVKYERDGNIVTKPGSDEFKYEVAQTTDDEMVWYDVNEEFFFFLTRIK